MNATDTGNPTSPSRFKTLKLVLLATVVAIVLVAAGYLTASIQGSSRIAAQTAEHEQALLAIQKDLQGAQQALASTLERNQLLSASAALYRTSADLDDRNFGTANAHLQEAAAAMDKAAEGAANPEFARLSTALGQMDINVATDLAAQRSSVLQLAAEIDGLAQGSE
jgi:predicted negative regulator of RcsB-dependent stress response